MGENEKMAKLIVDTNIIFWVFSRKSKVREIVLNPNIKLFAPAYLVYEIVDKSQKIIDSFRIEPSKFHRILSGLCDLIEFVPEFYYKDYLNQAYTIASLFDIKDTPFISLALKLGIPIWTNDRKMIEFGLRTGKYSALDTQAVEELLQGKSLEEIKNNLKSRYLKI